MFSLRSFRLNWPGHLKVFSVFLFSTLAIEIAAIAWKWELYKIGGWQYSNLWIYNAFLPVRHMFFLLFFYKILTNPALKKIILLSAIPTFIFSIINYFFIQGPHIPSTYTIITENIITILLTLAFFNQLLKDKNLIPLTSVAEVWICLGTLIFYAGSLPLFMLFNYLITEQPAVASSYFHIVDVLNIAMYLSYLIAFLCKPYPLK